MKLNTWLKENKKDYKFLAEKLEVHPSTACRYINGERRITLSVALKIEKITKGKVKCQDLN